MRKRVAVVLVAVLIAAFCLAGCKSEGEKAAEAVEALMATYVVPVADENGDVPDDSTWPAADFGDAATMEQMAVYGVVASEWHEHAFKNYSYTVGEATVADDGATATVQVAVQNNSFTEAQYQAAQDFESFTQSTECESVYQSGGRAALFSKLMEYLYADLDSNAWPKTVTVDVPVSKDEDGNWVPQVEGNVAFFNALYGDSNVVDGLSNFLYAAQ